jgi:hypothetical protein
VVNDSGRLYGTSKDVYYLFKKNKILLVNSMNPLSWKRQIPINYHYDEGKAWLKESRNGRRCTALAYAGFEFRLAIERIMFQYWFELNNFNEDHLDDIRSFKRMLNKIFKLAGNQNKIKKHIEFYQLLFQFLKIEKKFVIPNFSVLQKHYDTCCDFCHILWTIKKKNRELTRSIFEALKEIESDLSCYMSGILSFPKTVDEKFNMIKEKFVNGEISNSNVLDYIENIGLHCTYQDENGIRFIGTPVQPKNIKK